MRVFQTQERKLGYPPYRGVGVNVTRPPQEPRDTTMARPGRPLGKIRAIANERLATHRWQTSYYTDVLIFFTSLGRVVTGI